MAKGIAFDKLEGEETMDWLSPDQREELSEAITKKFEEIVSIESTNPDDCKKVKLKMDRKIRKSKEI